MWYEILCLYKSTHSKATGTGAAAIEDAANFVATQYVPGADPILMRLLSADNLKELWLRNAVEGMFEDLLKDTTTPLELHGLKRALFQQNYRFNFAGRIRD